MSCLHTYRVVGSGGETFNVSLARFCPCEASRVRASLANLITRTPSESSRGAKRPEGNRGVRPKNKSSNPRIGYQFAQKLRQRHRQKGL